MLTAPLTALKGARLYGRFRTWRALTKARARERIDDARAYRIEVGAVSPLRALAGLAVLACGLWAAAWLLEWHVRRTVNAEWRAKIAASSTAVRASIARADAEAAATDTDIINALGDTDAKLAKAEADIERLRGTAKPAVTSAPPAAAGGGEADPCGRCRIRSDSLR